MKFKKFLGVIFLTFGGQFKSFVNNFTSLSCQLIAVSLQLENKIFCNKQQIKNIVRVYHDIPLHFINSIIKKSLIIIL